jgi:hypothetical protein
VAALPSDTVPANAPRALVGADRGHEDEPGESLALADPSLADAAYSGSVAAEEKEEEKHEDQLEAQES